MKKLKLLIEKFGQSYLACLFAMVQGDLGVLTLGHFIVAGRTGIITGFAYMITSYSKFIRSDFTAIWLTGLFTILADRISHPSHFGGAHRESILTGIIAMIMALIYELITKKRIKL